MDWNKVLQVTLEAMLAAALPIVVAFLAAWLKAQTANVLQSMDDQTRWLMEQAAAIASLPDPYRSGARP